ncbi:MAG: alpha/beta hydrolase [Candidatus Binatia bacterium]|nr:alpha/beta hydrolase [Candidatus Binatia bacterium]
MSGFFESDGLQIHYESFGEGDPIILVHSWGVGFEFNWVITGWVDALMSSHQVIALDIRRHGNSDKAHERDLYSSSVMARDAPGPGPPDRGVRSPLQGRGARVSRGCSPGGAHELSSETTKAQALPGLSRVEPDGIEPTTS